MAKQKGIIKIKGTIGNLSFYPTKHGDVVRTKWGPDKERRKKDPAFAKAVKNSSEFGGASASASFFSRAVAEIVSGATNSNLYSRLNSIMLKLKNLDQESEHGKRKVGMGLLNPQAIALFKGFNFNEEAPMDSILSVPCLVDKRTGIISIEGISEKGAIKFPKGASHVCFSGGWARIDFTGNKKEVKAYEVTVLAKNKMQKNIVLKPTGKPKIKGMNFFILKIGFVQEQGGKQYVLGDKKYNSAAVVLVS